MERRKDIYKISTTTPIFSYGTNISQPEIRATSVRGMVRWWFRALGKERESNEIMGNAAGDKNSNASASKIIFRIEFPNTLKIAKMPPLPHKSRATQDHSIIPNSQFELHVIENYKVKDCDWELLRKIIKTWLMLGSLGKRGTRAGGCVYDTSLVFNNADEWLNEARYLTKDSKIEVYLSSALGYKIDELRAYCSDTIKDICLGSAIPRKESPLRFKIVKIGKDFHIAFINDARNENVLKRAISGENAILGKKHIGKIFKDIFKKRSY